MSTVDFGWCPVCKQDFNICPHSHAQASQHAEDAKFDRNNHKKLTKLIRRIVKEELDKNEINKSVMPASFC